MKSKAKLFLFFNTISLIYLEIDGKIKLSICMYCGLMKIIFPACFMITYIANFLTKQINTVCNIALGRCGKDSSLHMPIIFGLYFFQCRNASAKPGP